MYGPEEDMRPHYEGHAETRTDVITTTALEPGQDGTLAARRIVLEEEDAGLFIAALPVHAPVLEQS